MRRFLFIIESCNIVERSILIENWYNWLNDCVAENVSAVRLHEFNSYIGFVWNMEKGREKERDLKKITSPCLVLREKEEKMAK